MNRTSVLTIILLVALSSCERQQVEISDVNFTGADMPYEIIIDGFIGTEYTKYKVLLSRPAGVSEDSLFIPVNDAVISITNGIDIYSFELINRKGQYMSTDSIAAIPGMVYTLEVKYNGNTYYASDRVPENPIDEIYHIFERTIYYDDNEDPLPPDDSSIGLDYDFQNFGFDKNLILLVNNDYYDSGIDSLSDIVRLNGSSIKAYIHKSSLPQGVFPSMRIGSGFCGASTDSLEIINLNISESYHDYLITVFNVTEWSSGIFSTIPGNVKTNVSNGGTGYFYTVNSKRIGVTYKDLLNE